MTPVLETRGLSKAFGGVVVADAIDFTMPAGSVVGLVGPNGAGKSSLINLVCGTVPADEGDVLLHGRSISGLSAHRRARAGISRTWQHIRLFPTLSILDNLLIAPRDYPGESPLSIFGRLVLQDRPIRERALEQLRRVGMEHQADMLPGDLSIGRQKLASLARALMNDGDCLFLDEPVAGVEGAAYEALKSVIRSEAEAGRAICIVEHNISFIEDLCDHCAFMFNGSIVASGVIGDLMKDTRLTDLYFGSHA